MSYNHDAVTKKLDKLREMVVFKIADYKKHPDYIWCERMLDDTKNSGLVPNKEEFTMANLIWKKYNGGVKRNDEGMWKLIDGMLTQENPTKIGAIKMYRRFVNSTLREAKEMVDAREIKIKRGW